MRPAILIVALLILSLGFAALHLLPKPASFAFFQGAATLGGGLAICFAFSLRMPWHGIIGAAVLALLGFAKGLGNLAHLANPQKAGADAWMELLITASCAILLALAVRSLHRERNRRQRQHLLRD